MLNFHENIESLVVKLVTLLRLEFCFALGSKVAYFATKEKHESCLRL